MAAKNNWKDILPKVPEREPKPLTAISAAIANKDMDGTLHALLKLYLHEAQYTDTGTRDMRELLRDLSRLALEIKKATPATDDEKQKMLAELLAFIDQGKV